MKRILTLISLLYAFTAFSQQYNNEWIDYSKTYYKFKIGQTGLYRLPKSVLNTAGLGATPAEQFKLIRNGVEVPIYVTSPLGQLAADGYIEFWGEANDGKADKVLYRDPTFQHSDKLSLQTDTAMYFLTVSTGTNRRLVEQANNIGSSVLITEPYFMHTTGTHYRTRINSGFARNAGEYVYSSSYDQGEYFSSREIRSSTPLSDAITNLPVYTAGPQCYLTFGASGNTQNRRRMNVALNNTQLFDSELSIFEDTNTAPIYFPVSLINSGSSNIVFSIKDADAQTPIDVNDRAVVSYYDITYPRKFDFGQTKSFPFTLPAKNEGYLLAITNFNRGSVQPVLYDLTYGQRFTAVISANGDSVKFALPGTTQSRNLVLVNEESSNIITVAGLTPRTFIDFMDGARQGDYIIISNPILYNGANGSNPVADYRDYRRSAVGGGYNATIVEVDQLVDQFAFGIKKHPSSIKNFIKYAYDRFSVRPKYIFMIGRGVDYVNYRNNQTSSLIERLNLIPSFGYPASDNYLASPNALSAIPAIPIGRLSTVHPYEVADYLQKMKEYENVQKTAPNTIKDRLWMKNVMHVTGASQSELGITLCNFMHGYKSVFDDTLTGTKVSMFCKSSANPVEQLSSESVAKLFEEGLSMVTYFGHSSSTTLEFNIDNPENYNSAGKYPVFSVNGCNAGNFFTYYPQRLEVNETLSEKFVLAKERGAIAFLASTHFGIVNYLNIYLNALYKNISDISYGQSIGLIHENSLRKLVNDVAAGDFFARCHAEEITLHGDPALKMNFQEKPDYVLEDPQVKITPAFISIAEKEADLKVKFYNIGKAYNDSIFVEIKRQFPDGSLELIQKTKLRGIRYSDSLNIKISIIGTRDQGTNKIIITIDPDNLIPEMDENNNSITKEFYVYADEAKPSFPYEFSIVNDINQKLYVSTANPFSTLKDYIVEIDTTELFNSGLKVSKTISSVGGVMEFSPGIAYKNNTVYYWRVSQAPVQGEELRWGNSSFLYLSGSSGGFNQSHYYQHTKSKNERLNLGTNGWTYVDRVNNLFLKNAVYPTAADNVQDYTSSINGEDLLGPGCNYNEIIFHVIDGVTFKPWKNDYSSSVNGLYKSAPNTCGGTARDYSFFYLLGTQATRMDAMNFVDMIPDGSYVVVRSNTNPSDAANTFSSIWKSDATIVQPENSLYHKLYNQGFTMIDSFNRARAFIFVFKKNEKAKYNPHTKFSNGIVDKISLNISCPTPDTLGFITSPNFGPAKGWKQMQWNGISTENPSRDNPVVDIIGIDNNNNESLLFKVDKSVQSLDISSVDAKVYPYLKLKMRNVDSIALTPYQLNYWRVLYDGVPEGAIAPNLLFKVKDSLDIGENLNIQIPFKNISSNSFDSIKLKIQVIDQNNTLTNLTTASKYKPLIANDTLLLNYNIDTKAYPGKNTLYIDFNPDNDQPESYHFNNFIYRNFYVKPDNINPLLDVTFDGIHILNRDIVSSKPHIQIKVKDESQYMLLSDTSVVKELQVRYPDMNNTIKKYRFDNDTLRLVPASDGVNNTATIEFTPYFPTILDDAGSPLNPDGDDYELTVKAQDKSGNSAGNREFKVSFKVIDKPMISNLLNYPNPFTTSTAFVFTLTGSEIPQNMKIQILTVTGKIVKEITKEELGPVRIGRNITEYKWNGNDQYGQRLANGVYLYRVVTMLNGKRMDKYKSENDNTDMYFNKGYGKMYLMR